MKIQILTDSSCDLPLEYIRQHENKIQLIGMPIEIEGHDFIDDLGEHTDVKLFYDNLRNGVFARTSQIVPSLFEKVLRKNVDNDVKTVYIGLSSSLSGTFNNVLLAKNIVEEDTGKEGYIFTPDILSGSVGTGMAIMKAVALIEEGWEAQQISEWLEQNAYHIHHWFAVDDLEYLRRGGRISHISATVGVVLNIKPVLTINDEGKIVLHKSVRGRKKSIKLLAAHLKEYSDNNIFDKIMIGHGDCYEDAVALKNILSEFWNPEDIIVSQLSYTISTHVGPNMLALSFWGCDSREI